MSEAEDINPFKDDQDYVRNASPASPATPAKTEDDALGALQTQPAQPVRLRDDPAKRDSIHVRLRLPRRRVEMYARRLSMRSRPRKALLPHTLPMSSVQRCAA